MNAIKLKIALLILIASSSFSIWAKGSNSSSTEASNCSIKASQSLILSEGSQKLQEDVQKVAEKAPAEKVEQQHLPPEKTIANRPWPVVPGTQVESTGVLWDMMFRLPMQSNGRINPLNSPWASPTLTIWMTSPYSPINMGSYFFAGGMIP